jgi:enterochelin esterase family protein
MMSRGEIPPTLVVAAPDPAWVGDRLGSYDPAANFLADELLPMLRREYRITDSPDGIVAAGLSRRGMVSAYVAFRRPDAIARVLSLSGSYYWRPPGHRQFEWIPARFAEEPRRDIRLYLAAGELETVVTPTNQGHYLVATNRHMRDVLRAKGYEHRYTEFYGVHSTFNWQDQLAAGLVYLLGR